MKAAALCAALAACCAAVAADAPQIGKLRSYETPSYILIAADRYDARTFVTRLANFERVLAQMLATQVRPTGVPAYLCVVRGEVWKRYLQPSHDIVGEFVPRPFANYLLLDGDIGLTQVRAGLQHEYTHFFLHSQFRGYNPLWFDEGLAVLMSRTRTYGNHAEIGLPGLPDVGGWLPLARLMIIDKTSPEYLTIPDSDWVHRESWALVHRGLLADTKFGDQLFRYLAALNDFVPVEDAVQDNFGMSLEQLDQGLRAYLGRREFEVAKFDFTPAPPASLGAGRLLGTAETLEFLARVMLDTGFNPQHVSELIEAAAAQSPGAANVAVLRLRLAVRDRNDAEMMRIAQALQDESDAAVGRGVGLALFERVREDLPKDPLPAAERRQIAGRAVALLDRVLRATPDDAEAAWGYGMLAARLRLDLDTALARLARAAQLVPDNADLAMARALVYEARGEPAAMLPALYATARFSSSVEQRLWAAKRIQELRGAQHDAVQ